MDEFPTSQIYPLILSLEQKGLVTRTFRRLDPQRQQIIIRSILAEAAETGPADINIKKVAGRAGVSIGSLYQYFGSRKNLLQFAVELVVHSTVVAFDSYRPYLVEMPFMDALPAYLGGGIEWAEHEKAITRFFATAAYQGNPDLQESVVRPVAEVMSAITREMLARAAERGEVRSDIDFEATARLLNTLLIAIGDAQIIPHLNAYYRLISENVSPQRVVNAMMEMILKGISPEAVH